MDLTQTIGLSSFLALAVAWDIFERRIPNALVAAYALAAFALRVPAPAGLLSAAEGFVVGLGLLFVPFALGWVGAGDAKFFAVVGAFLGPALALNACVLGVAMGGPFALVAYWRVRRGLAPGRAATVPYAVPLALGALAALVCEQAGIPVL